QREPGSSKHRSRLRRTASVYWIPDQPFGLSGMTAGALFLRRHARREAEIEVARLERVLILAQRRIVGRQRNREPGRQAAVEQAGPFELVEARQVADHLEPEVLEE